MNCKVVIAALWPLLYAGSLSAQKAELSQCDTKDLKEKVSRFEVTIPLPIDKAYGRVVKAFTQVGLTPSNAAVGSGQVEWSSGSETNIWTGDNRARRITATLIEAEDDEAATEVVVSPYEGTIEGATGRNTMLPLTNKNAGYGKKVWCAARSISDSLTSLAQRLERRAAEANGHAADSTMKGHADSAGAPGTEAQ